MLQGGGWEPCSEPDNWRDSGWSVELANGAELILSHVGDSKYWIQIVPTNPPSLLKRLFKRDAYAEADAIVSRCSETLARELEAHSDIEARAWNWDGPPTKVRPSPSPDTSPSQDAYSALETEFYAGGGRVKVACSSPTWTVVKGKSWSPPVGSFVLPLATGLMPRANFDGIRSCVESRTPRTRAPVAERCLMEHHSPSVLLTGYSRT